MVSKFIGTPIEEAIATIAGDRRYWRRYLVDLPVAFRDTRKYSVAGPRSGIGRTLDMSSHGIAFISDDVLKVGRHLEVSVSWPVLLNKTCSLQVVASGRVIRSTPGCTALRLNDYEFRRQAKSACRTTVSEGTGSGIWAEPYIN